MLSLCNGIHVYVLKADYLVLDNHLVCSYLQKMKYFRSWWQWSWDDSEITLHLAWPRIFNSTHLFPMPPCRPKAQVNSGKGWFVGPWILCYLLFLMWPHCKNRCFPSWLMCLFGILWWLILARVGTSVFNSRVSICLKMVSDTKTFSRCAQVFPSGKDTMEECVRRTILEAGFKKKTPDLIISI